ncbi:T9SS type B sorting domain-containing protein [Nonlabens xiamenensis]|uniref:T9SS type B sorting domain-containing protein n=1 Tax=Nonlabens xiamenensis TaxID=2341043 RepID=UPI000F60808F|nr:T9SS type B sorting domain-containing protein [Nonlabens xiamenensis]
MKEKIYLFLCLLMVSAFAKAQLGFCTGQSGDAIFQETFGQGSTNGPALPNTVTTYRYVNSAVQDGEYTISSNMQQLNSFWNAPDHTGDQEGRMLLVNADFNAGIFYQIPINGLCENTPYEFSSWVINVLGANNPCGNTEIPIQVRFQIWDITDTNLLADGVMMERLADPSPTWVQYGLTFTTAPGQNGCILKLINEGAGGCGNDLAIDDIEFRTCGDAIDVSEPGGADTVFLCENEQGQAYTLMTTTTTSVYASPAYQWQESSDGVNYTDIPGATNPNYITPVLNSTSFYRVKVAEDAINLNNSQCVNFSNAFEFRRVVVAEPTPIQDRVVACDGENLSLEVANTNGISINWYDSTTGGTILASDTNAYSPNAAGVYYAESVDEASGCVSSSRTALTYEVNSSPSVTGADIEICPGESVVLNPGASGFSYAWSTGANTQTIEVSSAGNFTCTVTNAEGCSSTAVFNVEIIEIPMIENLELTGDMLTVVTANDDGSFLYSIDGFNYTRSNVFDISTFLQVTTYVRDTSGCEIVTRQFNRIEIPKFFTPNQDGFHDTFEVYNIEAFPGAKMEIFDRYGKLLIQINELVVGWDGTYRNQPMPSSDYWYKLYYNDQIITGHVALKR